MVIIRRDVRTANLDSEYILSRFLRLNRTSGMNVIKSATAYPIRYRKRGTMKSTSFVVFLSFLSSHLLVSPTTSKSVVRGPRIKSRVVNSDVSVGSGEGQKASPPRCDIVTVPVCPASTTTDVCHGVWSVRSAICERVANDANLQSAANETFKKAVISEEDICAGGRFGVSEAMGKLLPEDVQGFIKTDEPRCREICTEKKFFFKHECRAFVAMLQTFVSVVDLTSFSADAVVPPAAVAGPANASISAAPIPLNEGKWKEERKSVVPKVSVVGAAGDKFDGGEVEDDDSVPTKETAAKSPVDPNVLASRNSSVSGKAEVGVAAAEALDEKPTSSRGTTPAASRQVASSSPAPAKVTSVAASPSRSTVAPGMPKPSSPVSGSTKMSTKDVTKVAAGADTATSTVKSPSSASTPSVTSEELSPVNGDKFLPEDEEEGGDLDDAIDYPPSQVRPEVGGDKAINNADDVSMGTGFDDADEDDDGFLVSRPRGQGKPPPPPPKRVEQQRPREDAAAAEEDMFSRPIVGGDYVSGGAYGRGMSEVETESHLLTYLGMFAVLVATLYVLFTNRQKVIAFLIEGSRSRSGSERRRAGSGTKYHRLDNLEDTLRRQHDRDSDDKHVVF